MYKNKEIQKIIQEMKKAERDIENTKKKKEDRTRKGRKRNRGNQGTIGY